jgi:hypothetical protein
MREAGVRSQKSEIRSQEGERWGDFDSNDSEHKALPAGF